MPHECSRDALLAALRSGDYPEGQRPDYYLRGRVASGEYRYSAWGVVADLAVQAGLGRWDGDQFAVDDLGPGRPWLSWRAVPECVVDRLGIRNWRWYAAQHDVGDWWVPAEPMAHTVKRETGGIATFRELAERIEQDLAPAVHEPVGAVVEARARWDSDKSEMCFTFLTAA